MKASHKAHRIAVAALLIGAAMPAMAEVSAETDSVGTYLRTVVFTNASNRNLRIWTVQKIRATYHPLNPLGDLAGDLWPAIAESPTVDRWPWVVWSRFNGTGYDLGWSRWQAGNWAPMQWVEPLPTAGDDLDPSMAFDAQSRPYLAWWRSESGKGRIYLSIFLVSRWMQPFLVSDGDVDSYDPTVTIRSDNSIRIDYETAAGTITRIVVFDHPSTITDDITPLNHMSVSESTLAPKH